MDLDSAALLTPFLSFGMRVEATRVKGDDVPLGDLLPHHPSRDRVGEADRSHAR